MAGVLAYGHEDLMQWLKYSFGAVIIMVVLIVLTSILATLWIIEIYKGREYRNIHNDTNSFYED